MRVLLCTYCTTVLRNFQRVRENPTTRARHAQPRERTREKKG